MISTKAKLYARMLFALDSSANTLQELKILSQVFEDPLIKQALGTPLLSQETKRNLLKFLDPKLSPPLVRILSLLLDRQDLHLVSKLTESFQALRDQAQGEVQGTLESQKPLPPSQKKALEDCISKYLGKRVSLSEKVLKNSLGGVTAQVGHYVFEDSNHSHLKRFEEFGGSNV